MPTTIYFTYKKPRVLSVQVEQPAYTQQATVEIGKLLCIQGLGPYDFGLFRGAVEIPPTDPIIGNSKEQPYELKVIEEDPVSVHILYFNQFDQSFRHTKATFTSQFQLTRFLHKSDASLLPVDSKGQPTDLPRTRQFEDLSSGSCYVFTTDRW